MVAQIVAGVVIVFAIVQIFESFFVTPKLVGDKVCISEIATILALIIGGNLAGVPGMLMAIPTAGILKVLLGELRQRYEGSEFYGRG